MGSSVRAETGLQGVDTSSGTQARGFLPETRAALREKAWRTNPALYSSTL
jgi:hypothetical protein